MTDQERAIVMAYTGVAMLEGRNGIFFTSTLTVALRD